MTYSKASYLVSIFVKTNEQGNFVVDSIQIKKEKDDKGVSTTGDDAKKTPYVPGANDDNAAGNNFVFNNNYDPKAGNDNPQNGGGTPGTPVGPDGKPQIPDADKKGFALVKEIAGTDINVNEKFTFSITANKH